MNTANKAGLFKQKTEYRIKGLSQRLSKLSSVPNREGARTAAFVSLHDAFQPAAEYDGMLGALIVESFLGSAFAQASASSADNPVLSAVSLLDSPAAELFSEYIGEADTHNNYGRGRGSIALYERLKAKPMAPAFNMVANDNMPADYDLRMDIEQTLAGLQCEYYGLASQERALAPAA